SIPRPPPTPTPFPYTTLCRSQFNADVLENTTQGVPLQGRNHTYEAPVCIASSTFNSLKKTFKQNLCFLNIHEYSPLVSFVYSTRSEEHTSELQSRSDLVCRLL